MTKRIYLTGEEIQQLLCRNSNLPEIICRLVGKEHETQQPSSPTIQKADEQP